jgi:hypothetical protein
VARVAAGLLAAMLAACGLAGCSAGAASPLPDGPPPAASAAARSTPPRPPVPDDSNAAVPDVDPNRVVSPAWGPVRLATPPGSAAAPYLAYVGWVRAYLGAYAAPGRPDQLSRYATAAAAAVVRSQAAALAVRGWAEYGTARLVSVTVRVNGATATVRACLDLSGLATRDAAGRLAGRDRPVRSVATLTAPGWRVAADTKTAVARCG